MKQNEVVEDLQHIQQLFYLLKASGKIVDATIYDEPLTEAIRCVELVPVLVEALTDATNIAECRGFNVESARKLIRKATGMIE